VRLLFLRDVKADPEPSKIPSSDEIEGAIAQVWNDIAFDDLQSVFRDWIRRLAWVAENDGEYIRE
jgi:hypothetical protein